MSATEFPNQTHGGDAVRGLLVHSAGPAESTGLTGALRSAANAVAGLAPGVPIEVVIQGSGVGLLAAGSTLEDSISEALAKGIRILACGNSLRSLDILAEQLLPGVGLVPAAIAHLAMRQWEGWAYVRL